MKKVFSFCNQKGGVGKTTTAINVAAALSEKGYKILMIDLDPQGNTTSGFGIEKGDDTKSIYEVLLSQAEWSDVIIKTSFKNIFVVPAQSSLAGAEIELVNEYGREFVLKNKMEQLASEFDLVFIDCPPSLGLLTINAMVSSDWLIVPLQCEYYALEGLSQLLATINLVKDRLNSNLDIFGVVMNLDDFRTNLTSQVIDEVRNYFDKKVFETVIPRSVRVSEAPSFGQPAVFYDRYNKGSLCYIKVAEEIVKRGKEYGIL